MRTEDQIQLIAADHTRCQHDEPAGVVEGAVDRWCPRNGGDGVGSQSINERVPRAATWHRCTHYELSLTVSNSGEDDILDRGLAWPGIEQGVVIFLRIVLF